MSVGFIFFKDIYIYNVLLFLLRWFTTNNPASDPVFIISFNSVSPVRVQVQKGLCSASLNCFQNYSRRVFTKKKNDDPCLV